MGLYKPTVVRTVNGRKVKSRTSLWWGSFRHPKSDKLERIALGVADKAAAQTLLNERVRKAAAVAAGLANPHEAANERPILEHVAEWKTTLTSKGRTPRHVALHVARAERIIDLCAFTSISDLDADQVESALHDLRAGSADEPPVSAKTSNYYARAIKQFSRWLVKSGRASDDPLARLDLATIGDPTMRRRALSADEQLALVTWTHEHAPDRYGITGAERSLVYRLALQTGLRASEIASLTRGAFDLTADTPSVTVSASAAKNRKSATLPIAPDLVADLTEHLKTKTPAAVAFTMPTNYDTASMLRADLHGARAAWIEGAADPVELQQRDKADFLKAETEAGRVDFHALRHSFGSSLALAGVPVKVAMDLMRHSDVNLTMRLYSHTVVSDRAAALTALPSLALADVRAMNGTDGPKSCCTHVVRRDALGASLLASSCIEAQNQVDVDPLENKGKTLQNTAELNASARSSEGQSSGFLIRGKGAKTPRKQGSAETCCTHVVPAGSDPALLALVEKWPKLPKMIREAIAAMTANL